MAQNVWIPPPPQSVQRGGRGWLHALWIGLVLFLTGNPNLYPTVIPIGNFLVPVVFVTFLYDHQHLSTLTLETIGTGFILGGTLGAHGAAVLEALLIPALIRPGMGLTLGGAMLVGLIEEGCKIA